MKLILDQENLIIGYELLGGSNGYEIEQKDLPEDFLKNYRAKKFMLSGDVVVLNPTYQEPTVDIPELSGPSPEMLAINALGIQLAKHLAGGD